jgi:hypothetical protein
MSGALHAAACWLSGERRRRAARADLRQAPFAKEDGTEDGAASGLCDAAQKCHARSARGHLRRTCMRRTCPQHAGTLRETGKQCRPGLCRAGAPVRLRPLAPCLTSRSSVRAGPPFAACAPAAGAARNCATASSIARRPRPSTNGTPLACKKRPISVMQEVAGKHTYMESLSMHPLTDTDVKSHLQALHACT